MKHKYLVLIYFIQIIIVFIRCSSLTSQSQSQIENNKKNSLTQKDKYVLAFLRKEEKEREQKAELEKEQQYIQFLKQNKDKQKSEQIDPSKLHFSGKQMVVDLIGQPAYEINKVFKTPYNISVHPMVPEKEPANLMEMQRKIEKMTSSVKQYRFVESEEKNKEDKSGKFTSIQIQSAWASSVYSWKFLWWTYSYPAGNAIRATSFWSSAGNHNDDQVITWQGGFDKQYRVSHIWVRWAMAPREYSLQISEDGRNWVEKVGWTDISKGEKRKGFRKLFPWYIWGDMSFAMNIEFESPVWAKAIRILSRKVQYTFVGIYRVEVWVKDWVVMLVSGEAKNGEDEQCLQLQGNQVEEHGQIVTQVCIQPLAIADKRELFILANDGHIHYFNRPSMCLEADNSHLQTNRNLLSKNTKVTIRGCQNKNEQLWIVDTSHQIKAKSNPLYCVTEGELMQLSDMKGLQMKASSCANDMQHNIENVLLPGENYYMSNFNEQKVLVEFLFQPYKISELVIKWRKAAGAFVVKVLTTEDVWNQVYTVSDNSQLDTEITLGNDSIKGIKVVMSQFHQDSFVQIGSQKYYVYSIDQITIQTGVYKISMDLCKDSQHNSWFIYDVFQINKDDIISTFHMEKNKVVNKSTQLMQILQKLIQLPPIIKGLLGVAIGVKQSIKDVQNTLDANDVGVAQVADFINEKNAPSAAGDTKQSSGQNDSKKADDKDAKPIGVHSANPAKNCHFIKEKYTYKKSGFYWLKPECAKQPIRVFCDFEVQRQGIAYAYFGGIKKDKKLQEEISNIYQMRELCGKLGLEMVDIKGEEQFDTIKKYLMDVGVVLNTVDVIPLMYDYNCDQKGCKNKYNSLNDQQSTDLTGLLAKHVIKIFSIQKGLNSAGFGLSKEGKLVKFNLGKKYKVKGVVCSTNYDPKDQVEYEQLQCEDTLKSKQNLQISESSNSYTLTCPPGCAAKIDLQIYGQSTYKQTSSICRAAIHSGEIEDEGGPVLITTIYLKFKEGQQEKIQGIDNKGLQSLDFNIESPGEVGFGVQKVEVLCPLEKAHKIMKSKGLLKSTFLQTSMRLRLRSKTQIEDPSDDKRDNLIGKKDWGAGDGDTAGTPKNKGEDNAEDESEEKKEKFSNDIYVKVKAILDLSNQQLKRVIRLVTDGASLNKQINAQAGPLVIGELMADKQLASIETLQTHLKGSYSNIIEQQNKLKKIIKAKQMLFDALFRRKMKIREFEEYRLGHEDFDEKIDRLFMQVDYEQASNKPGKYSYEKLLKYNEVHVEGIVQQSGVKMKGGQPLASVLIHKYKTYYDLTLKASVLMNDNGALGLLFRVMDLMNYYAFVVDKQQKVKKVVKVLEGQEVVLALVEDGGFIVNQWYRVVIQCVQGNIKVQMEAEPKDKRFEKEKELELKTVLQAYDTSLSKGSMGYGVNNMLMSVVDDLQATPLECSDVKPLDKHTFTNNKCHYYREYFNADMVDVWAKQEDPNCLTPADWKYKKYKEYPAALRQNDKYTIKSDKLLPSWLLFIKDKVCNVGILLVEFIALDTGMVSIGFHFQNEKNNFQVQILPIAVNKCNIYRTTSGSEQLLQTNEDPIKCGYTPNQLMKLRIDMQPTQSILKVYNQTANDYSIVLQTSYDDEFPNAKFALGTLKTRAVFTRFEFLDHNYYEILYGDKTPEEETKDLPPPTLQEAKQQRECYQFKEKQDQLKFCSDRFHSDFSAIIDCQNNFCDRCCFLQEPVEKTKESMCVRKCLGGQKSVVRDKAYKQCIDSPKPIRSVYTHCALVFQEQLQQTACMRDMCQMCCLTFNSLFQVSMDLESVRDCRMMCLVKYRVKTQFEIDFQEQQSSTQSNPKATF